MKQKQLILVNNNTNNNILISLTPREGKFQGLLGRKGLCHFNRAVFHYYINCLGYWCGRMQDD
jgi:hypothetical protein